MDFLDPKKERRNHLTLLVGYCLVALAIGIATLLLLYQSYGYGIDRKGSVTQNGLLFVSSQPSDAELYLNGKRYKSNTDTKVVVEANTYTMKILKAGYRTWERQIVVNGGDVQHFDYPFLFPQKLQTKSVDTFAADPTFLTQSPDKRWVLFDRANQAGAFELYDLKNPVELAHTTVTLPATSFTAGDGAQTWTSIEWNADNREVLLAHTYTVAGKASREFVLVNTNTPTDSVNLTSALKLDGTIELSLFNNRTDDLYAYNPSDDSLEQIRAADGTVVTRLEHVLAYKTYSDNKILYVTDQSLTGKNVAGQVSAVLQDGQKTTTLRTLPAEAPSYVLNLAKYSGSWYVAVGASNDKAVYLYRNPQNQKTEADAYPAPWRRLPITNPSFLTFSANTQFLVAESGQNFVVFDFENVLQYRYQAQEPLDQPQTHATWMDGSRLQYVSGGKLLVFDYDYRNRQSLIDAKPAYTPVFSGNYQYLYGLRTPASGAGSELTSTPLVIKQ